MAGEPEITPEQLATFRPCTFARREFISYPSLWSREPLGADEPGHDPDGENWHLSRPYTGEPFDPEKWELRDGGWDHEHCDVCWATVADGMTYWPNVDPDAGQVDLCEACYPRVLALLGATPNGDPGRSGG